ncbi:hypothetical protein N481_19070 [Pseudoalteromonas luteoviolacea S4047-1]|uniref:Uncharacterized protein n=1 Tax=Pseudoalteromonas luteoviolacea S4054 TaxID=1129367 RepID=A0A0F6AFI5_9GAMM|nr:hypothetical protein N479_08350 [Pseudoalteromonas luteoviolacea S4054]KZN71289.1 hypothetical protein N481_19070 [Pseudoalteromonas luteoviolacea S4047-1]
MDNQEIIGFYALVKNTLAAIFGLPKNKAKGEVSSLL